MPETIDLEGLRLGHGSHDRPEQGMCVMEAVAFVAGEPFSDHPECASPVIGAFLRSWNDSSDDEQRQELKQYIGRLVGSKGTKAQEDQRSWMALDWLVRVQTPAWLRLAGLDAQAGVLEGLGEVTASSVPSMRGPIEAVRTDARAARDAARAAAGDAARAAAGDAAWAAARAAARDAARAAARDAARAAAWDAARAAAGDAAWAAAGAAAGAAAWAAAGAAAWARLAPTVAEHPVGAHHLVDRMLAITEEVAA
jgi:hypothetical protein